MAFARESIASVGDGLIFCARGESIFVCPFLVIAVGYCRTFALEKQSIYHDLFGFLFPAEQNFT
jgi:hypothetical protein